MKKIRLIIEKQNLEYKKGSVGYVLGTVNGQIIDQQNPEKVFYGASMPKLPMALAQLMTFKGTDKALTNKELSMLLDYSKAYELALRGKHKPGASSNEIFRSICKGDHNSPQGQSYTRKIKIKKLKKKNKDSQTLESEPGEPQMNLGKVSTKEEEKFLKGMGLEKLLPGICRSRPGIGSRKGKYVAPNRQTALGFFKFMSLIYQADELAHDESSRTGLYDEFVRLKKDLEAREQEAGMSLDEPRPKEPEIDPRALESSVVNTFLRPVFDEVQALTKGLRTKFEKPNQPEKVTFDFINREIFKRSGGRGGSLQMWGKGGFTRKYNQALHLAFVINEKYILSIYTDYGRENKQVSKNTLRKLLAKKVYEILNKNGIV